MDEDYGILGEVAGRKVRDAMALHDAELIEGLAKLIKETMDGIAKKMRDGLEPKEGG